MEPVIIFQVENQKISRTDKFTVVANSHDYLRARFTFVTDEWQGDKNRNLQARHHQNTGDPG